MTGNSNIQQGMCFVFKDTIQHLESELIRSVTQVIFSLMEMLLVCKKSWRLLQGKPYNLGERKSDKPVLNDFLIRKMVPRERNQRATEDVYVQEKHMQTS